MDGTVLITGANGSLALGSIQALLSLHPQKAIIGTVRNTSPEHDSNTAKLLNLVSGYPKANFHLEALDLGNLASVRSFADQLADNITPKKLPPISAIICNAATFSFEAGQVFTTDGYEATFQVCHLSHYLLILKLLDSMNKASGRIVLLGSVTHYPEKPNPLCSLRPGFPENMDDLVRPPPDPADLVHDKGFQRYGTAKLANVTLAMYLNRRLKEDDQLSGITALAMDPGGLPSSRAQAGQKRSARWLFRLVEFLMPVLRYMTTMFRTIEDAGRDLVAVSVGADFRGERGYYVGTKEGAPAAISEDREAQEKLWENCWRWAGMRAEETVLRNA
ncbi:short chain dehydrogenase/reductase SDR [Aspergillus eucalypticola CBS 122712]|uniref:Short chain dehydrogenase/reductase SDR n=1 Tax=Aspergillus eucalypticola (strain CBS 122712 / IBT 29274) TaxID=1448314 RepID=A0A317VE86_ASPEC|nr:short chain dehydrogenase/reductase SDR [Aspergillus eucalypticola CBS 122712]PWY71357.1 short chain dehydrogenase/reductase SDR [Aspergillus eucalypticola CBS 122712]